LTRLSERPHAHGSAAPGLRVRPASGRADERKSPAAHSDECRFARVAALVRLTQARPSHSVAFSMNPTLPEAAPPPRRVVRLGE
jgi:hypothetical protein